MNRSIKDQDASKWNRLEDGSVLVPLTRGAFAAIDEADVAIVSEYLWVLRPSAKTSYAMSRRDNSTLYLHRLIMQATSGEEIDHKDGEGLNNRRCNLRRCTHAQNKANSRRNGKLPYRGISFDRKRNRWTAVIWADGKNYRGKHFKKMEDAARSYDSLAVKHHGDFAILNFPMETAP